MWFEPDDCSRVAIKVVSFAINSVEKSRCLQSEPIMVAVRYSYRPLDDAVSIDEEFDILLAKAAAIVDPFEQSFFLVVHILRKSMQRSPTKRGNRRSTGPALICCRNSFSSSNDGTASRVDLRREDRAGPAVALPNCRSVPQWARNER